MRKISAVGVGMCTALLCGMLSPVASANISNKETIMTFNTSVDVPGHVLLPGTYVFKLYSTTPDQPDRNLVQIRSRDSGRLVAVVRTAPVYHASSYDHTKLTFERLNSQSPEAIKDWFFPGDYVGQQFLYPAPASHANGRLQ
jgi:hypothetical protein